MKLLHLSDIHLGKKLQDRSRFEDHVDLFDQAIDLIRNENIDVVLISGDLYDSPMASSQSRLLYHAFSKRVIQDCNKKLIVIAGNHDSAANIEYQNDLLEVAGYYAEGVFKEEVRRITLQDEYGDVDFYLLPHAGPVKIRDTLQVEGIHSYNTANLEIAKRIEKRDGVRSVLLMHGLLIKDATTDTDRNTKTLGEQQLEAADESLGKQDLGDVEKSLEINDEQVVFLLGQLENIDASTFSDFDYVALGHIHRAYNVLENMRYCGAPLPFTFAEAQYEKSFTVVEMKEQGEVKIQTHPILLKRNLIRKTGTFEELIQAGLHEDVGEHFYELILLEDDLIDRAADRLRAYYPNLVHVAYQRDVLTSKQTITTAIDADQMQPIEVLDAFFEFKQAQSMTNDQREIVKEVLSAVYDEEGGDE